MLEAMSFFFLLFPYTNVTCLKQLLNIGMHSFFPQTSYETSHPDIVNMCLEVVGGYVSWMDISFFANDRMVTLLLRFLVKEDLREAACDTVHDIVSKGMEPVAKTSLVETFMRLLDSAGIFNCNVRAKK